MEDGHGVTTRCNAIRRSHAPRVLCGKAMMATCASNLWRQHPFHPFLLPSTGEPETDRTVRSSMDPAQAHRAGREDYVDMERHVPELCDWVRNNNEVAPK